MPALYLSLPEIRPKILFGKDSKLLRFSNVFRLSVRCFSQQFILKHPLSPSFHKSGRRNFVQYITILYTSIHAALLHIALQLILFRDVL
jgi:hypothetical protein